MDRFSDPLVGYVCGEVSFTSTDGATNQEGVYWRYELLLRRYESQLASITAGNGAIYATRAEDYLTLGPLNLNLLGLVVTLNQVHLTITAVPGAGNLLGNLLCAVANLLNGTGSLSVIAALLNGILALL